MGGLQVFGEVGRPWITLRQFDPAVGGPPFDDTPTLGRRVEVCRTDGHAQTPCISDQCDVIGNLSAQRLGCGEVSARWPTT